MYSHDIDLLVIINDQSPKSHCGISRIIFSSEGGRNTCQIVSNRERLDRNLRSRCFDLNVKYCGNIT